jgi:hypothetical protein
MKIDDVISAACEELNCSYEANALWFEVLINQAIRSHKTTNKLTQKSQDIVIDDNKSTLPKDFVKLNDICFCNNATPKQVVVRYCPDIDFTIQGDTLIFLNPIEDGTKLQMRYVGLNLDSDGNFIVPDDWERMLVAYIGWKHTRRYAKEYGIPIMQNYQREYQTQKLANV